MSKRILFLSLAFIIGASFFVGIQFSLAADQPDLTVANIKFGSTLAGAVSSLSVTVTNLGGDLTNDKGILNWYNNFSDQGFIFGSLTPSITGFQFDRGALPSTVPLKTSESITFTWFGQFKIAGTKNLQFTVNNNRELAESNYNNNFLSQAIVIITPSANTVPTISDVKLSITPDKAARGVGDVIDVSNVAISWKTDLPASSYVTYSTVSNFSGAGIVGDDSKVTEHLVNITGLPMATLYYYKLSHREASEFDTSTTRNFTTFVQPVISVLSPNGGESWQKGTAQTVKWQTEGIPATSYMTIRLRHVGYDSESPQTTQAPNNGSATITPDPFYVANGSYKIEIETYIDNVRYVDTSDASFTITDASAQPSITVLSPNGGEGWQAGQTYFVKWSSIGIPQDARISLNLINKAAKNNIGSWITMAPQNSGQYNFVAPLNAEPGSNYEMLISVCKLIDGQDVCADARNPYASVSDRSNSYFTIGESVHQYYDWEISNLSFPGGIPSYGKDLSISYQIKNNSKVYKAIEFRVAFYLGDVFIKDIGYVSPSEALNIGEVKNYKTTIPANLLKLGAQVMELRLIVNFGSENNSLNNKVGAGINILQDTTQPPCIDSDGGKDPDIAGLTDGRVNGIGSYFKDISVASNGGQCSGESCTSVAEGYCTADGKVSNILTPCSTGYSKDGACATKPGTQPSLSASLLSSTDDHAGAWTIFGPGIGNINKSPADWNWTATLKLPSEKTISLMALTHNSSGEMWSTGWGRYLKDGTDLIGREEHPYPLVVFFNGKQLNSAYDQELGTYEAGVSQTFTLYAQQESTRFNGGKLIIEFTDGTVVTAPIMALNSSITPTTESTTVKERVKCVFKNSVSAQKCYTTNTETSNSLYYGGGCGGVDSCGLVDINGKNGVKITWKSSCGGYAYTVLDGVDEIAIFDCAASTTTTPTPTTSTISRPANEQILDINEKSKLLSYNNFDFILAELNQLRSIVKEQQTQIKYLSSLLKDVKGISTDSQDALNNFITYGVDANTEKLGAGERAAVINSYKAAFSKLPETEAELADAIKIANGRWPSVTNDAAEKKAKEQFQKIYKRIADMDNANDNAAVTIMAYGLRQKAENRNLNSEKQGINTFNKIYGRTPNSTEDWNIMQAVTYSGTSRGVDSDGDLLTDDREKELGTDPKDKDTDGDGYLDGAEVANGYDPLKK